MFNFFCCQLINLFQHRCSLPANSGSQHFNIYSFISLCPDAQPHWILLNRPQIGDKRQSGLKSFSATLTMKNQCPFFGGSRWLLAFQPVMVTKQQNHPCRRRTHAGLFFLCSGESRWPFCQKPVWWAIPNLVDTCRHQSGKIFGLKWFQGWCRWWGTC